MSNGRIEYQRVSHELRQAFGGSFVEQFSKQFPGSGLRDLIAATVTAGVEGLAYRKEQGLPLPNGIKPEDLDAFYRLIQAMADVKRIADKRRGDGGDWLSSIVDAAFLGVWYANVGGIEGLFVALRGDEELVKTTQAYIGLASMRNHVFTFNQLLDFYVASQYAEVEALKQGKSEEEATKASEEAGIKAVDAIMARVRLGF